MLKKRREILLVAILAAIIVIGGRFFAAEKAGSVDANNAGTQIGTINQQGEPEDRRGPANVVNLNGSTPSGPVRVGSNQCIQWWGDRPDTYRVEVAGIDGDDWQANETFLAKKKTGTPEYNFPAWYRFVATNGDDSKISYKILRGLCQ